MAFRRRQQGIPGLYGGDARGLYGSRSYGRRSMIYGKPPTPLWQKILLAVLVVIVAVLCVKQFACGGILPKEEPQQQEQVQQDEQQPQEQPAAAPAGPSGTITISAVGDCTLGTDPNLDADTNFTSVYKTNNAAYFFKRVAKYTEADDFTIANLESAITDQGDFQDKGENSFNFKGPSSYTNILTKGSVEICGLANNHSFDYGTDGYADTKKNLKAKGIGYACSDLVYTAEANGIKLGFLSINGTSGYDNATEMMTQAVKDLKAEGCNLIVGNFHWGTEAQYGVDAEQVKLGHAAIDAGVDLVLGSHPHVLQGVEVYKDRYIVYSLGNFVFGGNDHPMDFTTMIFQQSFTFENGELVSDASLKSARVVPCRVSSTTTINNYQPLPLGGSEGSKIVKDVNKRSAALKGTGAKFATKLDDEGFATVAS